MADKKIDEIDIETLSDEDFMKLDAPVEVVEETKENDNADALANADKIATDLAAEAAGSGDTSTGADAGNGEGGQEGAGADGEGGGTKSGGEAKAGSDLTDKQKADAATKLEEEEKAETDRVAALSDEEVIAEKALADEAAAAEAKIESKVNDGKETLKIKEEEGKTDEEKKVDAKKEEAEDAVLIQELSDDFYKKVSAPFKADGKEVQVRTPEEAIRLMQMGVNYSRRMEEMKPLRAMDAMLAAHGLNDPAKLNELIDLSKGSKEAINKHLKKHNIDPLDLDASKGDDHTTPNYQSDPKDVAFQDAIDTTLLADGGKELLADINADWDAGSKEALRDNPSIFGKLLEQKDAGVYSQIQKELLHQRTMGYLANVPFLQAYEQVGNAMKKAGVFDAIDDTSKKTGLAPIHSGSRKSAAKPKTAQTNPNLSSSKTTAKPAAKAATTEPDYLSMSDEDFMNLAPPG